MRIISFENVLLVNLINNLLTPVFEKWVMLYSDILNYKTPSSAPKPTTDESSYGLTTDDIQFASYHILKYFNILKYLPNLSIFSSKILKTASQF